MLHVLFCSLSDPMVLAREKTFLLWPLGTWNFSGYAAILSYSNILTGYLNTLFYVTVGTAITNGVVCLTEVSKAGTTFTIVDVSAGTNAGTYFGKTALASCSDTVVGGMAASW